MKYTNEAEANEVFDGLGVEYTPQAEEEVTETETTPTPEPRKLRVRYNGEDKDLTEEEAITYSQKGMNYDKVKGKLDALQTSGADDALAVEKLIADSMGMTPKEYREYAKKNVSETALKKEMDKIYEESPDISEELAKELANTRIAAKNKEAQDKQQEKEAEPWEKLAEEYPDLKSADDIPEDVRTAISNGKDPLLAMREHDIAELKKQLDTKQQEDKQTAMNEANKNKALGSVKGEASSDDEISKILWNG